MNFSRVTASTVLVFVATAVSFAALSAEASAAPRNADSVRLVVGFHAGAHAGTVSAAEQGAGVHQRSTISALHSRVVTVASTRAAAALTALRADPAVAYAELDGQATTTSVTPNDPYFPTGQHALSGGEWGDAKTQAPAAWGITTGSADVTVAVLDSGVASTQPDLSGVIVPGWNVLTGTADTTDTYGHGTSVSGVAVASSNNAQGVAAYCWTCKLMPVKVSTSSTANYSDIAKGITWAVDHGARVLNISIAGTTASSTLTSAVSYATSHGAVVVAAAGNNGSSAPMYPAAIPGVISVAATDQLDALTSYSEYGSWVDLAAPGSTVSTLADGTYSAVGGTSIASPTVAGIAALLLSVEPSASPGDIATALTTTTDPTSGTNSTASGRVNAYRALLAVGGSTQVAPPAAPTVVSPPAVSGAAQSGKTLSASTGSWSGSPTSYAYQWQRCDSAGSNCAAVAGATTTSYPVTSTDVGLTLRVGVIATNAGGSGSSASAPTAVVTAGTTTTTLSGSLTKNAPARSFMVTVGTGPASTAVSFSRCSSLDLSVATSSGTVLAGRSGASVLSMATSLSAGSYVWTVTGTCRVSFTVTVTAAS